MEQSEIIEYYPVNFKTDLNGKQQEWEAVVLIPFIDEVGLPMQSVHWCTDAWHDSCQYILSSLSMHGCYLRLY